MSEITVKYKAEQNYCGCCHQQLKTPKVSKEREFTISKSGASNWTDWERVSDDDENLKYLVPDYVHDTIRFHALNFNEHLVIEDSEIARVKEFLIREFPAQQEEG